MSRNSSANTRVSIPGILRKTIQDIKEVSGNHSDEDVYAMLKECSMDPNETAQRLLFLDTFHEVKRKQKRKDNVNGRMLECSTWKRTSHRRGAGSGLGSFSSQYKSPERVTAVRKENGLEVKRERGLQSPSLPVLKEVEAKLFPPISKTSFALVNGPTCLPSDGLYDGHAVQNSETVTPALPIHVKDAGLIKPVTTPPQAKLNEERVPFAGKIYTSEFCSSRSEKSEHISLVMPKMKNGESLGTEKLSFFPVPDTAQSSLLHAAGPDKAIEEVSTKLNKLKFPEVQHVILPDHIQVPDAVKNVLSFGSLDARVGAGVTDANSSLSDSKSNQSSELLEDGSAERSELCDDEGNPTAQEESYPDPPQTPQDIPETISSPRNNFSSPKDNQVKQEITPAVGPPYPIVQPIPAYGFGFMPPMLGSPLVQIEGLDHQARLLNTAMGNSLAMSTAAPTLSPAHSPGAPQSSVAASAQSLPHPRQPYPPNIIPYAHYLPPFFMPPTLQYLGHGGFPPQFPTGNMYLPAAAAASGMKVAPAYKPGSDVMSQTPTGAFGGVYVSPEVGYNPSAAAQTSGSSNASQDLLKESNNVYLGQQQQCEGTTVHSTSMPVNPFFNLPPQMGPGAFSPVYHPLQTVAAQQPVDAMAALPELVGPTSFHQQQQINWNNGGGF